MFNARSYFGTDGTLSLSDVDGFSGFSSYFGEDGAVGRVTNITLSVTSTVKPFHGLGARLPRELRVGRVAIAGTVERAYLNGALLKVMLGDYAEKEEAAGFRIPTFNMKVILDNLMPPGDEGNSVLTVYGLVFDNWQFSLPEDDFVLERLSFQARRLSVQDSEVKG